MPRWAQDQPRDGEIVATCAHGEGSQHWFRDPDGALMPDGCRATMVHVCETCFVVLQSGGPVKLVDHGEWQGDAPVVEEAS